jgi:hypothetical protein
LLAELFDGNIVKTELLYLFRVAVLFDSVGDFLECGKAHGLLRNFAK